MTMTSIGWAIIHSLWQGGVIALITAGMLAVTKRPDVRYLISLTALAMMVVLPIATAIRTNQSVALDKASFSPSIVAIDAKLAPVVATTDSPSPSPRASSTSPSIQETIVGESFAGFIEAALPWLVTAWMIGLLIASTRLIGGFTRTRRVTRQSTSPASRSLEIRIERICSALGITRAIRALESTAIDVPLVVGAIRPVIVMPVSLISGLTPLQLDMLIAHELAHVRRHDYLVNLIQTVIETLLFYHPAARWISDRAREEREHCCDDIAMSACSVDAVQYTSTLLVLEESRGKGFGLAAAATGGSLLKRAQRLLTGRTYLELGPRWIAGVFTIGTALFAGNEAFAGIQKTYFPVTTIAAQKDSTGKRAWTADTRRAAPSKVTNAPKGGSISDRWRWAEKNGGTGPYWIGYLVADDPSTDSKVYASDMPVRIDGGITMTGRMNFGDGDLSGMLFHGVPLAPIVGQHRANSTAMFFLVRNSDRIEQVHLGTFSLPGYFDNKPLVWLDSAGDAESVALISSIMRRAIDEDTQRDMVAALGVHGDAGVVVPPLIDLLQSRENEGVRREAAEWLGRKNDSRAITALSRVARADRSHDVRREAIEAFSHMRHAGATDSLIAFTSALDNHDLQRTAIEAIGDREDDRALSYLTRFARGRNDGDLRRQAVEALSNMDNGRGMNVVIDIARNDGDPDVRREAIESLAGIKPAARALEMLREIVRTDPDESVQSEAIETIAEVHDAASVAILADIVNHGTSERLQVEAVESLGETVAPARALPIVREISRKHPVERVREKALETLDNFKDKKR